MLGMAAAGNTSDIFGLMDQQQSRNGGHAVKTELSNKGFEFLTLTIILF